MGPEYEDEVQFGFDRLFGSMVRLSQQRKLAANKRERDYQMECLKRGKVRFIQEDDDSDSEFSYSEEEEEEDDDDVSLESEESEGEPVKKSTWIKSETKYDGNSNGSIRDIDWSKTLSYPEALLACKDGRYRFIVDLQQNKTGKASKALLTFRNAEDIAPTVISSLFPVYSSEVAQSLIDDGFDVSGLNVNRGLTSCDCQGCSERFVAGGWVKQLAYTFSITTNKGNVIKLHSIEASSILSSKLLNLDRQKDLGNTVTQGYCERTFQKAVAIRSMMQVVTTLSGGFICDNAARLRVISCGIAREEIGRRLVENGSIPAVKMIHVESTRSFFDSLNDIPDRITGKIYVAKAKKAILDRGTELFENGLLDPLSWEELLYHNKNLGHLGSMSHIIWVRALFEGRCNAPEKFNIPHYDYLINSLKGS